MFKNRLIQFGNIIQNAYARKNTFNLMFNKFRSYLIVHPTHQKKISFSRHLLGKIRKIKHNYLQKKHKNTKKKLIENNQQDFENFIYVEEKPYKKQTYPLTEKAITKAHQVNLKRIITSKCNNEYEPSFCIDWNIDIIEINKFDNALYIRYWYMKRDNKMWGLCDENFVVEIECCVRWNDYIRFDCDVTFTIVKKIIGFARVYNEKTEITNILFSFFVKGIISQNEINEILISLINQEF